MVKKIKTSLLLFQNIILQKIKGAIKLKKTVISEKVESSAQDSKLRNQIAGKI